MAPARGPSQQQVAQQQAGTTDGEDVPNMPPVRSLMLPRWQKLQAQLEGRPYKLPVSGAQTTLDDVARETQRHLEESGAEDIATPDTDIDAPYEEGQKVGGWFGTPDPSVYAPGTTYLSPEQLAEEVRKGNVVATADWLKAIDEMEPWRQTLLERKLTEDWNKSKVLIDIPGPDGQPTGKVVSLWHLHQYIANNPELKAVVDQHRKVLSEEGADPLQTGSPLLPLMGSPDNPYLMELSTEQTNALPWALVGEGKIWRRRPTRWLKGMDGKLDWKYAVYVHEQAAEQVLGPKWAGHDFKKVVEQEEYWEDVLAAGPALGMTFALAAARDIPIGEAAMGWNNSIVRRMLARGESEEVVGEAMGALTRVIDIERIATETRLLTPLCSHVRQGSVLLLTTLPEGKLLVQGYTADPVRTREYYGLGVLHDAQPVCETVISLALGGGPGRPQEPPLDEQILFEIGHGVAYAANGFKWGNLDNNPLVHTPGARLPPAILQHQASGTREFNLPRIGAPAGSGPPLLLDGLQEQATMQTISNVWEAASEAAEQAVEQLSADTAPEAVAHTRKTKRMAALIQGLSDLELTAPVSDLFAIALPLQQQMQYQQQESGSDTEGQQDAQDATQT